MAIIERPAPILEGDLLGRLRWARGDYDFAVDGGAVGDIVLAAAAVPQGALVLSAYAEIETILASAGAPTAAIKVEAAADMQAAAAFNGAPWSTVGPKALTQTFATAPKKTTANRDIVLTVAVAALTGGKFRIYVAYIEAP